jgi:anti-sigma28 factor (negative regulator of flagellin synthesis)
VRAPDQQYWLRQYPAQAGPQYPGQYNPYGNPYPSPYGYNPYGNPYPSPYQYNPYAPPPPPQPPQHAQQLTEDSVRRIVKEALSELLQRPEEKEKEREGEMEAEIPIAYDKDGTPIMGKVRGNPAAIVGMIIASGSSRGQSPDESMSGIMKAMQQQLEKLQDQLGEAERRADEAERRRLEDSIKRLEDQMDRMEKAYREQLEAREKEIAELRSSIPRGEYKSDAYRFIDSAATKIENLMKDRRPLEKLVEVLRPPQPGQPTTDQEALEELKRQGLVVES